MTVDGRTMRIAKVMLCEEVVTKTAKKNVVFPFRRARVILENGAIFDRYFDCWSITETFAVQNFKDEEDKWTRYNP